MKTVKQVIGFFKKWFMFLLLLFMFLILLLQMKFRKNEMKTSENSNP